MAPQQGSYDTFTPDVVAGGRKSKRTLYSAIAAACVVGTLVVVFLFAGSSVSVEDVKTVEDMQRCVRWEDTNLPGGNLGSTVKTNSPCQCQAHCWDNQRASIAFSWVDPNRYTGSSSHHRNCHCKDHLSRSSAVPGDVGVNSGTIDREVASGTKEDVWEYVGKGQCRNSGGASPSHNNIGWPNGITWEDCRDRATDNPLVVAWECNGAGDNENCLCQHFTGSGVMQAYTSGFTVTDAYMCYVRRTSLSPRAKKCKAKSNNGHGREGTCVFPFTHDGTTYQGCAEVAEYGGVGWCAFHSSYQSNQWGYCTPNCPGYHLSSTCPADSKAALGLVTSKGAGSAGTCTFPFEYDNVKYTGCAQSELYGGVGWCSFDAVYNGRWGYCTETCQSMEIMPDVCPDGFELTFPGSLNGECQQSSANTGETRDESAAAIASKKGCAEACIRAGPETCAVFDWQPGICFFNRYCDLQDVNDGYTSCRRKEHELRLRFTTGESGAAGLAFQISEVKFYDEQGVQVIPYSAKQADPTRRVHYANPASSAGAYYTTDDASHLIDGNLVSKACCATDSSSTTDEVAFTFAFFGPHQNEGKWVKGSNGQTCDQVCNGINLVCDPYKPTTLTSNSLVGAAFAEAGYTCRSYHVARNYAGTPFSKNTQGDDCAPWLSGTKASCTANDHGHHAPLCYCRNLPAAARVSSNHPNGDTNAGDCVNGLSPRRECELYCNKLDNCNGFWYYESGAYSGRCCPKSTWNVNSFTRTIANGGFYLVNTDYRPVYSYEIFTAADDHDRDPTGWILEEHEGAGDMWSVMAVETGVSPPSGRQTSYGQFQVTNGGVVPSRPCRATWISENHPNGDTSAGECKNNLFPMSACEDYCNSLDDCNGFWYYNTGRCCPKSTWTPNSFTRKIPAGQSGGHSDGAFFTMDCCPDGWDLTFPTEAKGQCQQDIGNNGQSSQHSAGTSPQECAKACAKQGLGICTSFDWVKGECHFNKYCDYQDVGDKYLSCMQQPGRDVDGPAKALGDNFYTRKYATKAPACTTTDGLCYTNKSRKYFQEQCDSKGNACSGYTFTGNMYAFEAKGDGCLKNCGGIGSGNEYGGWDTSGDYGYWIKRPAELTTVWEVARIPSSWAADPRDRNYDNAGPEDLYADEINGRKALDHVDKVIQNEDQMCRQKNSNIFNSFTYHDNCYNIVDNIAYRFTSIFYVRDAFSKWKFDFNIDFGLGGGVAIDGKLAGDWEHGNLRNNLEREEYLQQGWHIMEAWGLEGCCDGGSNVKFMYCRNTDRQCESWTPLTVDNLPDDPAATQDCTPTRVLNSVSYSGSNSISGHGSFQVTCNPGYGSGGLTTCNQDTLQFSPARTCNALSCPNTHVPNSRDYSSAHSLTGNVGMSRSVVCTNGYEGGGTATCGTNRQWNSLTCSAKACAPSNFANSDTVGNGAMGGNVLVVCRDGYHSDWHSYCQSDSNGNVAWSSGSCTARQCASKSFANSNTVATGTTHQTTTVVCNTGYGTSTGASSGISTCGTNQLFSGVTCAAKACTGRNYPNSNYKSTQVSGVTGEQVYVTCDQGYRGTGFVDCQTSGTFTSVTCTPRDCTNYQVDNSIRHSAAGSITGRTHDSTMVECRDGYGGSSTGDGTVRTGVIVQTTCTIHGSFSPVACGAVSCPSTQVPNSNLDGTNAISGSTGAQFNVICDTGYYGGGMTTCMGTFTARTCTAVQCAHTEVAHSNFQTTDSIRGVTTDQVTVTCHAGYTPSSSEANCDTASRYCTVICKTNSQFMDMTCTANACTPTNVPDSTKSEPGSITGTTSQFVPVTCDEGYFGTYSGATCNAHGTFTIPECHGFAYIGCYTSEEGEAIKEIPGWPEWSCDVGSDTYYAGCARMGAGKSNAEYAAECAKMCTDMGDYAYFDVHDATGCYCGKGSNAATEAPSHRKSWESLVVDTNFMLSNGLDQFSADFVTGHTVRLSWGSDYIEFIPEENIFSNRPNGYQFQQTAVDNFKTSDARLQGWVDAAGGAIFCMSPTRGTDTAWAVLPKDNTQWATGCSSHWLGKGAYYGAATAGWVGVKGDNEEKAGTAIRTELTISLGDPHAVPATCTNYLYALDASVAPCASTGVAHSDKSSTNAIFGVTGETVDVVCHEGYSGGGTVSCQASGSFTTVQCPADSCTSTQVPFSDREATGSIMGTTTQQVSVTCIDGYAPRGTGHVTCQTNGEFSPYQCEPIPCQATQVPHSDHSDDDSISGVTTDQRTVVCDPGYTVTGTQNDENRGEQQYVTECQPNQQFKPVTCTPMPCNKVTVPFSNYKTDMIMGVMDESRTVLCDLGYSPQETTVFCRADGQFDAATCTADSCFNYQVTHSNKEVWGSIQGTTTEVVNVQCHEGYSVDGQIGTRDAISTCMPPATHAETGTFTAVTCPPNPCADVNVPFSDYATEKITGTTTDTTVVTCDPGYSPTGQCDLQLESDGVEQCSVAGQSKIGKAACEEYANSVDAPFDDRCSDGVDAENYYAWCNQRPEGCWQVTDASRIVFYNSGDEFAGQAGFAPLCCAEPVNGGNKLATCQPSGVFTEVTCTALPCADYSVPHSDKKDSASITGVTTDVRTVTCDAGYSPDGEHGENGGSKDTACQTNELFEEVVCTPKPCADTQVEFSDFSETGSMSGVMDQRAYVTCDTGYSADMPTYSTRNAWADCEATEVWTTVTCSPNPCTPYHVPNSNKKERDSITGVTLDVVGVVCDPGYSTTGEWGSPQGADLTCNPSGVFDTVQCLPNPCEGITVANSDRAIWTIEGRTTDTATVTCNVGYEINPPNGVTECQINGTFSYVSCKPTSSLDVYVIDIDDKPAMTGRDDDGKPVWNFASTPIDIDYFAPPLETESMEAYKTTTFMITKNTIAFTTGGGSSYSGGGTIDLITGFDGQWYSEGEGIKRNSHEPDAADEGATYDVTWDVTGLIGHKATIVIADMDPDANIVFDNLRMYDAKQGCLPECMVIEAIPCAFYKPGDTCFIFQNDGGRPYVPSNSKNDGSLTQYCRYSEAPFGEASPVGLLNGWMEGSSIESKFLQASPELPECLYIEINGPKEFGIAISPDRIKYDYSRDGVRVPDLEDTTYVQPERTATASGQAAADGVVDVAPVPEPPAEATTHTYCIYDTSKPRCADYSGILRTRNQHTLACKEVEPELSCLEIIYDAKCSVGSPKDCGEKKSTQDIMKCCSKAYNDPGAGCLKRRRRRLNEASAMAIITDVEAAESCAESCFRRGMGPGAGGDSCVAWRLDAEGKCVLATSCYYPEVADAMLLGEELWNTIEGVDMFVGAPKPKPKQVRKFGVAPQ